MTLDKLKISYMEVHKFDEEQLREFTAKVRSERLIPVATRTKGVAKGKPKERKEKGDIDIRQLEADIISHLSEEVSTNTCETPETSE